MPGEKIPAGIQPFLCFQKDLVMGVRGSLFSPYETSLSDNVFCIPCT